MHGKIYIADNEKLSNLSLSDLQTVGGEIDIEENDDLRDLVFEELEKVEGALILKGVFDECVFPPFFLSFVFFEFHLSLGVSMRWCWYWC